MKNAKKQVPYRVHWYNPRNHTCGTAVAHAYTKRAARKLVLAALESGARVGWVVKAEAV